MEAGGFPVAPEPAQGIGEVGGHAFAAVEAGGPFKVVVVTLIGESAGHEFVGSGPVSIGVVEVVLSAEQVNTQGFGFDLTNQGGVSMTAAQIDKAADPTEDFAKAVWAFPGDGEGADAA